MEQKILDILVDVCGDDEVIEDKDINLFDSGFLDSLGVIELLLQIEEVLDLKIQPTEITRQDIQTPNKVIELILKRV
ncbi:D-alanine--poly(phosphoribitol) ligase subunit 2 [Clostridium sporogenes]|jgi:D-alanine--poly(phosphoribitol) ligase subunit 2|uniref:D-alanyl carrier protein n=2 Tax=Clostridium TaxID=1485 RepID=A0AAE4Z7J7_CLOSG|nr:MULTISPECIES: D-alanine--poly(phosphoribitol) ligase subunit DltC [Clostridium]MBE6078944.1 D-alanine--poly(phosphoribitol) ligase subunit DltC [Clostridium lundense]APF28125.1 D-alanine--poly(phosphoribitol) ligase, subunit 2 [Clostridium sporogenes]EDU39427.1 D-alanine--poly(phosphoribitol) ligase, subunit 2 [Clostridium sporogenes ATCC 15579]EKS4346019.1 D-alanine--poly(phosphoribitol) ligase subunit DltC [Clostridium botulinum]EKS4397073.1 D-alanine--poly(phosphoribitol) ligase subunit 